MYTRVCVLICVYLIRIYMSVCNNMNVCPRTAGCFISIPTWWLLSNNCSCVLSGWHKEFMFKKALFIYSYTIWLDFVPTIECLNMYLIWILVSSTSIPLPFASFHIDKHLSLTISLWYLLPCDKTIQVIKHLA